MVRGSQVPVQVWQPAETGSPYNFWFRELESWDCVSGYITRKELTALMEVDCQDSLKRFTLGPSYGELLACKDDRLGAVRAVPWWACDLAGRETSGEARRQCATGTSSTSLHIRQRRGSGSR